MKLKDKKVVVLGGTGAIGGAIVELFLGQGAHVVFTGSTLKKIRTAEKNHAKKGAKVKGYAVDVVSSKNMSQFFKEMAKELKKVDVLVVATGVYGAIGKLHETRLEDWKEAIDVNLFGTVNAIKEAFPLLSKNKNSRIVVFAGGGEGPKPHFSSYVSSKAATIRLMETLSEELKEFGIEINGIAPGAVVSQFNNILIKAGIEKAGEAAYKEALEQIKGEKETVPPAKVAELALFLSSDEAQGITGRTLSTLHDTWRNLAQFKKELMGSDIYTYRRIKPKDRGYDWK